MPFEAAIAIAGVILFLNFFGLIALISHRRRQAKEEELRQAASVRGWTFNSRLERGKRIHTWTGSSDGVAWTMESIRSTSKSDNRQHRRYISRWHGAFVPGVSGPILLMGVAKGKEVPSFAIAQGDGFVAKLAQKAAGFALDKGIDAYFGEAAGQDVDAAALHHVEGAGVPGYIVMAVDKAEGTRVLSQGLDRALRDASSSTASPLADESHRPWILLRPNGMALGHLARIRDARDLEALVHAGVGLTRAFTFGRPSLS